MRRTVIRILRHGIPSALILALMGYVMAEMAGIWIAGQSPARSQRELLENPDEPPKPSHADELASTLRTRLPLTLAAWGFGLVVAFELLLKLWRGNPAPIPPAPAALTPDQQAEQLLNQLLAQADADRAAKEAANVNPPPIQEPPPP